MKSDAFSLVDKSTVNRDFSVAEASFNLKLDLISQMHHCIEPRTIYHKAQRRRINSQRFPRWETCNITEAARGKTALNTVRCDDQTSKSPRNLSNLSELWKKY